MTPVQRKAALITYCAIGSGCALTGTVRILQCNYQPEPSCTETMQIVAVAVAAFGSVMLGVACYIDICIGAYHEVQDN